MRVLHVVGRSEFGGGSQVVLALARKAREAAWHVDVLANDPVFRRVLCGSGVGVVNLEVIWRSIRPLRDLTGLYRLYQFLRRNPYDVVHTHTSKGGFVGRLAAHMARVPVIVHTVHGFAFHEESLCLELAAYVTLERTAAHWCHRIVTVSEFHRDWALKLGIGNPRKMTAIPNGIPVERVIPTRPREATRAELGLAAGELALLTVGRLARQKGLEDLIAAAPILASRMDSPFKLLLVGEGPLRSELEREVERLDARGRVVFTGFRSDVADLLAASDIVVLPSLWEGLSIALLEAMAAGKPIVTTTIGSNREVVRDGENGLLVPTKRPDKLAEAIITLARDKDLRKRLSSEAKRVHRQRYTEERMAAQYLTEYQRLCRAKGLPRP